MKPRPMPIYRTDVSRLGGWLRDVREGIVLAPAWIRISVMDVNSTYRRFFLGSSWVTLGMLLFVFALGYVYSYLRGSDYTVFTPYLAAGMVAWTFIHASVTQAMNVFVSSRKFIENVRLPFHYFIFKTMFDITYNALLTLPVYLFCLILFKIVPGVDIWRSFAAFPLFMISSYGVIIIIGTLNLRIRDIQTPLSNLMRLMFLITPVIWMVEERAGGRRAAFVDYNPFYHYMEILRAPMLGNSPQAINWIVAGSCTAGLFTIACIFMILSWRRIHYWV